MEFTDIITCDHILSRAIAIVDSQDNVIRDIVSYNTKTHEAVLYKRDRGRLVFDGKDLVTETKVLEGARIVFIKQESVDVK